MNGEHKLNYQAVFLSQLQAVMNKLYCLHKCVMRYNENKGKKLNGLIKTCQWIDLKILFYLRQS